MSKTAALGLGTAVLLVLGGVAWFLLSDGERVEPLGTPGTNLTTGSEVTPERPRDPAELSTPAKGAPLVSDDALVESEREALETSKGASAERRGTVRFRGTVVLLDLEDQRLEHESGTLVAELQERAEKQTIEVLDGQFELDVPLDTDVRFEELKLGSSECWLEEEAAQFRAEEGTIIELIARRFVPCTLVVRDRVSGQDLRGIEVWNREGWNFSDSSHPRHSKGAEKHREGEASPILLPKRRGKQAWWVRVRGFAWERIDFDHAYGGEQVALLERESTLRVRLENRPPDQTFRIDMHRDGMFRDEGSGIVVKPEDTGQFVLDGLRPGDLRAGVFLVHESVSDEALLRKGFTLKAGQQTELVLTLPEGLESQLGRTAVTVAGTLDVAGDWKNLTANLEWNCLDEGVELETVHVSLPLSNPGPGGLYSWTTEELTPGVWSVQVTPFGHLQTVVIGPAGNRNVALQVPELAEVRVRVVEASSRQLVSGASVSWYRESGGEHYLGGHAVSMAPDGSHRVFVVPGEIQLLSSASNFSGDSKTFEVHAGLQHYELELTPTVEVVLILKEGTTVVKREIHWWLGMNAENLDGEGEVESYSFDGSANMSAELSSAGTYRFTFGEIDGYLPIQPLEVTVETGTLEVTVPLVREN